MFIGFPGLLPPWTFLPFLIYNIAAGEILGTAIDAPTRGSEASADLRTCDAVVGGQPVTMYGRTRELADADDGELCFAAPGGRAARRQRR